MVIIAHVLSPTVYLSLILLNTKWQLRPPLLQLRKVRLPTLLQTIMHNNKLLPCFATTAPALPMILLSQGINELASWFLGVRWSCVKQKQPPTLTKVLTKLFTDRCMFSECDPWMLYENSYIPGYNDDVGFSLTIEECKKRCESETSFKCISFDYWKARKQCYLSSYTATKLQIRLSYDSRMVHYMLTECPTKTTTTTTTTTKPGITPTQFST